MKTKHTEGTWITSKDFTEVYSDQGDGRAIAFIRESHKEFKENAILIAAAKELLRACQVASNSLLEDYNHYKDVGDKDAMKDVKRVMRIIDDAIQKATT